MENNCIYKVHPIFNSFTSDIYGNISDTNKGKFMRGYFLMGVYYLCVKDGIILLYKYSNFVLECHHGIIPENFTIENIDGNKKSNQLSNLNLVPLKVNEEVGDTDTEQKKISKKREIEIEKHELKKYLQTIESCISKIHMKLDVIY